MENELTIFDYIYICNEIYFDIFIFKYIVIVSMRMIISKMTEPFDDELLKYGESYVLASRTMHIKEEVVCLKWTFYSYQ